MKDLHFRIDTPQFLKEVISSALVEHCGVLQVPFATLINFLGQVSDRCAEINDPILNRLMFDMNLYDLPSPTSKEYRDIMEQVYKEDKEFRKNNKRIIKKL